MFSIVLTGAELHAFRKANIKHAVLTQTCMIFMHKATFLRNKVCKIVTSSDLVIQSFFYVGGNACSMLSSGYIASICILEKKLIDGEKTCAPLHLPHR